MVIQQLAPASWLGTYPEYLVYQELTKRKIDFEYQSSQLGGRQQRGGAVIDFLIVDRMLGINIQSEYWHYQNWTAKINDTLQRKQLEAMGIRMIYIDETDIEQNPAYYVGEALKGNDLSRMVK